jgi:hypothetical protein
MEPRHSCRAASSTSRIATATTERILLATALKVFGPESGLGPHELRRRAKIINYALLYGKTAFTLSRDIGVTTEAAKEFIAAYFARLQKETLVDFEKQTLPGVVLGQKQIPVNAVGSYTPSGQYPMFGSSIMTVAVPKVAGVKRVVAVAPPRKGEDGKPYGIYEPMLYTMATPIRWIRGLIGRRNS